jgi:Glycosyltransferase family 9 (heptosyltransferase)
VHTRPARPFGDPRRDRSATNQQVAHAEQCLKVGELDKARSFLHAVLELEPDHIQAHKVMTALFIREMDWAGLRIEMERGLKRYPTDLADYERSYLSLLFGEMPEGWDLYESRLRIPGKVKPKRSFTEPRWKGEPFRDKTLLLHAEQGYGDTFMFVRYAPMVKALGGKVLLLAQKQLAGVAATCSGIDAVIPEGSSMPAFDLQLPLPSLPQVFRTDLTSIPAEIPYLDVPEWVPYKARISGLLAASAGKIRIGCSWAGSPTHSRDKERSMHRKLLEPLHAVPGVAWHSFQFGVMTEAPLPGIVSLAPVLSSFSDTAYALSGMDLVITVDTALAHLAGALGIPVLLMVHFQPDFRWMLHREDSPWYPTVRIYRQPRPGDWGSVVQAILRDLTAGA